MTSAPGRIAAVLAATMLALLPACTQQPRPHGVVTGLLIEFGGPSPGIRLLVPGHVTATSATVTQTVTASRHGRFRFSLPPGVYHLTAQSGGARCGRGARGPRAARHRHPQGKRDVLGPLDREPGPPGGGQRSQDAYQWRQRISNSGRDQGPGPYARPIQNGEGRS